MLYEDSCISFDSYIKPQLSMIAYFIYLVVYLLIPTSNHNPSLIVIYVFRLYIFWFLHQTTTLVFCSCGKVGCISFDSYIKPQHTVRLLTQMQVVYLLIPTSNHNRSYNSLIRGLLYIFWFLHQTTTRHEKFSHTWSCISFDSSIKPQLRDNYLVVCCVVYLLIPTSNHNPDSHQVHGLPVVYLLIPTSNHNLSV